LELRRCKCCRELRPGDRGQDSSGYRTRLLRHVLPSKLKRHSRVHGGHLLHHFGSCLDQWKHPRLQHHRCLLGGHSSMGQQSNGRTQHWVNHVHSRLVGCCFQTLPGHQLHVRWNLGWWKLFDWKMSHPIHDSHCSHPELPRRCRYRQHRQPLMSDHCWGCNHTLPFHSFATLRCSCGSFSSSTSRSQ